MPFQISYEEEGEIKHSLLYLDFMNHKAFDIAGTPVNDSFTNQLFNILNKKKTTATISSGVEEQEKIISYAIKQHSTIIKGVENGRSQQDEC